MRFLIHSPENYLGLGDAQAHFANNQITRTAQTDEVIGTISKIHFSQYAILYQMRRDHKNLYRVYLRFGGLCELICNQILQEDLLGKGDSADFLRKRVTVETLSQAEVSRSHILHVHSIFSLVVATLFEIYPNNMFSMREQRKLLKRNGKNREINWKLFQKGLERIEQGETIKMEVFYKEGFFFQGHSLLIKKVSGDSYIFFDPNCGEERNLSGESMRKKINRQIYNMCATGLLFIRGRDYLRQLGNRESSALLSAL